MASTVDLHKSKVARRLDFSILLAVNLEGRELSALEGLVAWPLELVGPGFITEPVADEVGITSVDENGDLFQDTGHKKVEWLHPVTLEEKIAVNIEVAAVVSIDGLNTKGGHDLPLVEVRVNVAQTRVTEATALAIYAYVVGIAARLLIGTKNLVVTVD